MLSPEAGQCSATPEPGRPKRKLESQWLGEAVATKSPGFFSYMTTLGGEVMQWLLIQHVRSRPFAA